MNKPRKSIIANFGALAASSSSSTPDSANHEPASRPLSRVGAGVIGATQKTLSDIREERDRLRAQLEAGGGLELDPNIIEPSPFPDRLPDDTEADFEAFKKQIEEEGQKIPIQVRHHPAAPERYQIVYGHRRWRAAKELRRAVKALVVTYSDTELVVAQGIENAARQDLTWIERALFACRMDDAGIRAKDIRAALCVDDSELARLRSVCRALPETVLRAIGRAPKVGRLRWLELATAVTADPDSLAKIQKTLSADKGLNSNSSDNRFLLALGAVRSNSTPPRPQVDLATPAGKSIGKAIFGAGDIRLFIASEHSDAFTNFLKDEIPAMIDRFLAQTADGS